jgi:hypothetical protein
MAKLRMNPVSFCCEYHKTMKSIQPTRRCQLAVLLCWAFVCGANGQTNIPAGLLPDFRYHGVVLSADDLKYRPRNDVIYPSVVRMAGRPGKLGNFYLYYSPHDSPGGICLAYADRLEGPWLEHTNNPIISRDWPPHYRVSHVSGSDALWDEKERKVLLYYHGENGTTRLAASTNGIDFLYEGVSVTTEMFENVSEASYGRVFRHSLPGKDNGYIMLLMGNNRGTRRIYLAWSKDGRLWESRRAPLLDPPPGTDQVAGAVYLPRGERHFLIFHANNSKAAFNKGFGLYVAETDAAMQKVTHLGKFMDPSFVSPENPAVMSPSFIEDSGRLHLFLNIGPRLQNQIALAIEQDPD